MVVLVAIYAAFGFWAVPRLVSSYLPPWLVQHSGLRLTLGPLAFNPFRFSVDASNVELRTAGGAPLLFARQLVVDSAPSGLLHRTWTIEKATLSGLQVHLVLEKDGSLDLVELLHRLVPVRTGPATAPPRVVVDRLEVVGGQLLFADRRGAGDASASITPISIEMNGLSTIPGRIANHTLSAGLPGGATLQAHGDLSLEPALSARGQFSLKGVPGPALLPFLRNDLRIERLEGHADLATNYAYSAGAGLQLDHLAFSVADFLFGTTGGARPLLALKKIDATGGKLTLAERRATLASLSLSDGDASVALSEGGQLNWAGLVAAPAATAPTPTPAPDASAGWQFAIKALQLDRVALAYEDRQRQPPLALTIGSVKAGLGLTVATGPRVDVKAENLHVQARDMALPAQAPGGAAVRIGTASVDGGQLDLGARHFAAQTVSVEGGDISIGRNTDGSIDLVRRFAPVDARMPSRTGPVTASAAAADWRYDIGEVRVGGIALALADRSIDPAFHYDVRVNSARVRELANRSASPASFEAALTASQGGTLSASGQVFADGARLDAQVRLDQLALGPFEALTKRYTGMAVAGGPLKLMANVHRSGNLSVDHLDLDLPKLTVRRRAGGEPILSMTRVQVEGGRLDLAKRQVVLAKLTLADGAVNARVQADGQLDWQVASTPSAPTRAAVTVQAEPWTVDIEALKVSQLAAHYADFSRPKPLSLNVARIDLGMGLQLSAGSTSPQVAVRFLQARVQAASLSVDKATPAALTLASAELDDGTFDLQGRKITAARLSLKGGGVRIVRDAQGRIDVLDSVLPASGAAQAAASAALRPARTAPAAPWQYAIADLDVDSFGLAGEDRSFDPPLALAAHLDAKVQHLSSHSPSAFDATLSLADAGGSVRATGSATPASGGVHAHVVAQSLGIAPMQPLVSRFAALTLRSGTVGSNLTLDYAPGKKGALRVSGAVDVDKLRLDGTASGERFLSVRHLGAQRIDFDSAEKRLSIGEVELLAPETRIAIAKDHSLNLTEALAQRPAGAASQPAASRPAAPAPAPEFRLGVQRVRIRQGDVDFSDQSLVLPFATKVTAIDATIAGVSNDGVRRADVQARGSIQKYGSASVDGSLMPFDPRRFTDLRVKFNNVLVQPFSPYTATFAGRTVQSGKLWLDLDYKIDKSELLGENDVRLADFTLGERVKSASATDLPLNLAVSLLTDAKGEINLSVPVRGDLGNPHFDLGDAIGHAFGNILGRIVTAPFRLLGRLFGSGDASVDNTVDFAPGSAALAPDQREKLDALATAFKARPLLRLVVSAPYDNGADRRALQQAATRRALAQRLKLPTSGDPGSTLVAFDDPATRSALQAMAAEQSEGPSRATAVPSPAPNPGDRAAAEALFDRVAKQQSLSDSATRVLATERATRIADFIVGKGIDRGRIQTGLVEAVALTDEGTVDATLQLSAAKP